MDWNTLLMIGQLLAIVVGGAAVFIRIGRRDGKLDQVYSDVGELKEITKDLVTASVESACKHGEQERTLKDLRIRLHRLENRTMESKTS